jgi:hypothetical protein
VIQGKRVISALDVNALQPGKHFFYFQGVQMPSGQHWYVSVIVANGARAGKRITLVSGVHGDEMSPWHDDRTGRVRPTSEQGILARYEARIKSLAAIPAGRRAMRASEKWTVILGVIWLWGTQPLASVLARGTTSHAAPNSWLAFPITALFGALQVGAYGN